MGIRDRNGKRGERKGGKEPIERVKETTRQEVDMKMGGRDREGEEEGSGGRGWGRS
jgi:hypothetical protein